MSQPTDPGSPEGVLRSQIGTLGEKFLKRTADQLIQIQEQLRAFAQGDRSVLGSIGPVAHMIHGSGAVFGFKEISEAAGALEQLTTGLNREITSTQVAAGSEVAAQQQPLTRLTAAVEQLARALDAVRAPTKQ